MKYDKINILIVDDHPLVLEGLSNIVALQSDFELIGKCADAIEGLKVLRSAPIHVVITDINLPKINGIDFCKRIKSEFPEIKVIGMSTFHDPNYVSEILQAGASAFMTKNSGAKEFENAIRSVIRGEVIVSPLMSEQKPVTFSQKNGPLITRREKEVLQLIAEGLTTKEIADKLFVSNSTVDSHRKNLLTKFNVLNTAALISHAIKNEMI